MSIKDFKDHFEAMKTFKADNPSTADDAFFTKSYTRMRKFVKKLEKIHEVEAKILKKQLTPTQEQLEMIGKKKELEISIEGMVTMNNSYMQEFLKKLNTVETKEEVIEQKEVEEEKKEPEVVSEPKVEEPRQPDIDIEAIRKEEFERGLAEGKNVGFDEGKAHAYEQGKQDGYQLAKEELQSEISNTEHDVKEKAVNFASLFLILGIWVDN